jgi:hypothetical protein
MANQSPWLRLHAATPIPQRGWQEGVLTRVVDSAVKHDDEEEEERHPVRIKSGKASSATEARGRC